MQFNLSEIAKTKGAFRPITPPSYSAVTLWRIYNQVLTQWRDAAAGLIAGYSAAATISALSGELDGHNEEILALISTLQFAAFFASLEQWQRGKWVAEVQRVTKVDVGLLLERPTGASSLTPSRAQRRAGGVVNAARVVRVTPAGLTVASTLRGVDAKLADAVAANVSLVRSVSDDTRARIANAVFAGVQSGQSKVEVARAINKGLKLSSKRARSIAKDQVDKAVKNLTMLRFDEAGFEFAEWVHSHNPNFRREHLDRNGNVYALGDPIWSGLYEPFCGCWPRASWPKP